MKKNNTITHTTKSNGNVFADLGFNENEAKELFDKSNAIIDFKLELMNQLNSWIEKENKSQQKIADMLGITRPRVSDIKNKKISKFTIDYLIGLLQKINIKFTLQILVDTK